MWASSSEPPKKLFALLKKQQLQLEHQQLEKGRRKDDVAVDRTS